MSDREGAVAFELTCLWFAVRDWFTPPMRVLQEAGITQGAQVLDYACGPGSYALAAARLVGKEGHVYAADCSHRAITRLRTLAARKGQLNLTLILTDCATGLESNSIDVALLYDACHDLVEPQRVLKELHRVLKPGGLLSFNDHHLPLPTILGKVTGSGLFSFLAEGRKTYTFRAEKG